MAIIQYISDTNIFYTRTIFTPFLCLAHRPVYTKSRQITRHVFMTYLPDHAMAKLNRSLLLRRYFSSSLVSKCITQEFENRHNLISNTVMPLNLSIVFAIGGVLIR